MLTEIPNREGSVIPPVGDESLLPPSLSRFSEQGQEYKLTLFTEWSTSVK